MDGLGALYTLFVCSAVSIPCEAPFGWAPSLTRQRCLEQLWSIHDRDKTKRVMCTTIGGDDVLSTSNELRQPDVPDILDMLGQPPTSR